jgi:hypothetical protein
MQTRTGRSTFWNKLMVWAEALDSTQADYHQDQLIRIRSELGEVTRRVQAIECGVTISQECGNDEPKGVQHVHTI